MLFVYCLEDGESTVTGTDTTTDDGGGTFRSPAGCSGSR